MATIKEVYEKYCPELIRKLPIDDAMFKANLVKEGFFSTGTDIKAEVYAQSTRANKTSCFLEKVIEPNIADEDDPDREMFDKLLKVMEKYDAVLKKLAAKIKAELPPDDSGSTAGASGSGSGGDMSYYCVKGNHSFLTFVPP